MYTFLRMTTCSIAWSSAKLEKIFKQHNKEVNERNNANADRDDVQARRDERLSTLSQHLRVANVLPSEYQHHNISDAHRKADYFFTTPNSPAKNKNVSSDCNESNRAGTDSDETTQTGDKAVVNVHDSESPSPTSRNTETADVEPSQPTQELASAAHLQKSDRLTSLNIGDPWIELMECMKNRFVALNVVVACHFAAPPILIISGVCVNSEKTINRYQKNLENVNELSAVAVTTLFKSRAQITSTVKRTKRRLQRAQAAWDKQKRDNAAAAVAAVAAAVAASVEGEDQEGDVVAQPSHTAEQADDNQKSETQTADAEKAAATQLDAEKDTDKRGGTETGGEKHTETKTNPDSATAQIDSETKSTDTPSDAEKGAEEGTNGTTFSGSEKQTDTPTISDKSNGTDTQADADARAISTPATANAGSDSDDDSPAKPLTQAEQLAEFKKQQHERLVALGLVSVDEEEHAGHPEGEGDATAQRVAQERADRRALKEMAEKQAQMAEENARLEAERERMRLEREATIKREAEERAREIEERHRQQEEERKRWQEEVRGVIMAMMQ